MKQIICFFLGHDPSAEDWIDVSCSPEGKTTPKHFRVHTCTRCGEITDIITPHARRSTKIRKTPKAATVGHRRGLQTGKKSRVTSRTMKQEAGLYDKEGV